MKHTRFQSSKEHQQPSDGALISLDSIQLSDSFLFCTSPTRTCMPVSTASFPVISPKPHLTLQADLPGQIYTLDGFLSPSELEAITKWTKSIPLEEPKKPGKGEAERTASESPRLDTLEDCSAQALARLTLPERGTLDSPEIAQMILNALAPHLSSLDPPYTPKTSMLSSNIRVYHYPTGTYFRGHYDSPQLDTRSKRLSCWTVLVYLSHGVSGGGTTFWPESAERDGRKKAKGKKDKAAAPSGGMTFEPIAGRLLLHWHGVARGGCMLHEGDLVTKGDKWVLRTDVLA